MLNCQLYISFRLCEEYEAIAEQALTTPANTEKLMELRVYIENVEKKTIHELEKDLVLSRDRLSFLVDYASFSPAEIRLNSSTFQWHDRMPEIFAEHKSIVDDKTSQYQDGLTVRHPEFEDFSSPIYICERRCDSSVGRALFA